MLLSNSPTLFRDPLGLLSGRRQLQGHGWHIQVDPSCDSPCCDWTTHDRNLDKLLNKAYLKLNNAEATKGTSELRIFGPKGWETYTVEWNIAECMRKKMESGNITLVCHTGWHLYCSLNKDGFMFTAQGSRVYSDGPVTIHVCCLNYGRGARSPRSNQEERVDEHYIARNIMHEISHSCGAADPEDPESRSWIREEHFGWSGGGIEWVPNAYAIGEELVENFSEKAYRKKGYNYEPK